MTQCWGVEEITNARNWEQFGQFTSATVLNDVNNKQMSRESRARK